MMKDKESKGKEGLEFLLAINPFLSQALQEINENKRKQRPGERIRMQMKNEITVEKPFDRWIIFFMHYLMLLLFHKFKTAGKINREKTKIMTGIINSALSFLSFESLTKNQGR